MSNLLLQGKLVNLRAPMPQDEAEFISMNRASSRFHAGLVTPPKTAEQFADFLRRMQSDTVCGFIVCRRSDNAIAGTITLSQIFYGNFQSAYLGYYLGKSFTGKGYMTEAVRLMLRYAFTALGLHRIEANVQPHNQDSLAVLQRVGFVKEGFSRRYLKIGGRWRDHERWTMLVEDWRANRKT
jgi:[ribosomal protein S5]-alanine N-acetyltransferase